MQVLAGMKPLGVGLGAGVRVIRLLDAVLDFGTDCKETFINVRRLLGRGLYKFKSEGVSQLLALFKSHLIQNRTCL